MTQEDFMLSEIIWHRAMNTLPLLRLESKKRNTEFVQGREWEDQGLTQVGGWERAERMKSYWLNEGFKASSRQEEQVVSSTEHQDVRSQWWRTMDSIFKITRRAISTTSPQKCQVIKETDKLISVGLTYFTLYTDIRTLHYTLNL